MNKEQSIFSQLIELAPRWEFNLSVWRYAGNLHPRKFSYWDQFLTMAFAQVTYRESLRDIEVCLSALPFVELIQMDLLLLADRRDLLPPYYMPL